MSLEGNWEVGLSELHYPQSWKVFQKPSWISILVERADGAGKIQATVPVKKEGPDKRIFKFPLKTGQEAIIAFEVEVANQLEAKDKVVYFGNDGMTMPYTPSFDLCHVQVPPGNYSSPSEVCGYINHIIDIDITLPMEFDAFEPGATGMVSNYFRAEHDKKQNRIIFTSDLAVVRF